MNRCRREGNRMSNNTTIARLRPDPFEVFRFAETSVELRYRLLMNYLGAKTDAGELSVPQIVRQTFNLLIEVTNAINDGRPEDRKIESHVIAAREMVGRFEREWLSRDHRSRMEHRMNARNAISELTDDDWAAIRREGYPDEDSLSLSWHDAELLRASPFRDEDWNEYEATLDRFVDTFDPPCRTLYRLIRALAAVNFPDPASYDPNCGTSSVLDDEYLIKHVYFEVRQLIVEFQNQTCFNLNVGGWFDARQPHHSAIRLFEKVRVILRGWRGEVSLPPELDRPRWERAQQGSKHKGVLTFRGKSGTVATQSTVIAPVLQAFEEVAWLQPVSFPSGKARSSVLQSLNTWASNNHLPIAFSSQVVSNDHVCRWHPKNQSSEPECVQECPASSVVNDAL